MKAIYIFGHKKKINIYSTLHIIIYVITYVIISPYIYLNIPASDLCYLNLEDYTKIYVSLPRVLVNMVYTYIGENIPETLNNIL